MQLLFSRPTDCLPCLLSACSMTLVALWLPAVLLYSYSSTIDGCLTYSFTLTHVLYIPCGCQPYYYTLTLVPYNMMDASPTLILLLLYSYYSMTLMSALRTLIPLLLYSMPLMAAARTPILLLLYSMTRAQRDSIRSQTIVLSIRIVNTF